LTQAERRREENGLTT